MKLKTLRDGEWIRPKRNGWIHECCDCGLRHSVDFRLVKIGKKRYIYFKWRRI